MRIYLALSLLVLLSSTAKAQVTFTAVTGASEQLAADAKKLGADIKAVAPAAVLTADRAAVVADTSALALALGVTTKAVVVGKYRLDFSLGGSLMALVGFPATSGVSVGGGAGACVLLDTGVGINGSAPGDIFHLILPVCISSVSASAKTTPAVFFGAGPAFQLSAGSPLIGVAGGGLCPTAKGVVMQQVCMVSLALTIGASAIMTSTGIGAL